VISTIALSPVLDGGNHLRMLGGVIWRLWPVVCPATTLRIFLLMNYIWQIKLEAMKGIIGHKRPLRWQRVKSYWQVIRSGLRPAGY
jgi:hypothetical protein